MTYWSAGIVCNTLVSSSHHLSVMIDPWKMFPAERGVSAEPGPAVRGSQQLRIMQIGKWEKNVKKE